MALCCVVSCRRVDDAPPRSTSRASAPEPEDTEGSPPPSGGGGPRTIVVPDFAKTASTLRPSVVTVISTVPKSDGDGSKVVKGLGSGMIVSYSGEVLTNEHVVASATRVDVELSSLERIPAEVAVAEPKLDLALLKLEHAPKDLQPVSFADRRPDPGQWVMAVGQPFGLGHTVTVGVVSGLDRDHDDLGRPAGLDPNGLWSFIQTDASINVGNSGGPLVDASGVVIGMTTAVRSDGQGLAFAIPSPMAKAFLNEARTYRRVRMARLGINADNISAAEMPGRGFVVRVTRVDEGGPGFKAGLKVGDYILRVGTTDVVRVSQVAYLAQLAGVGSRLSLTIKRADAPTQEVIIIPDEA
jgi:S1-C subfamily serine protease